MSRVRTLDADLLSHPSIQYSPFPTFVDPYTGALFLTQEQAIACSRVLEDFLDLFCGPSPYLTPFIWQRDQKRFRGLRDQLLGELHDLRAMELSQLARLHILGINSNVRSPPHTRTIHSALWKVTS